MNKFIVKIYAALIMVMLIVSGLMGMAFAGVIMEHVTDVNGNPHKGTIYISKNKVKILSDKGQGVAIFDLNTNEMIQIDNKNKRYVVSKPEDLQAAAAKMRAKIEAQLSKLPPEQRAKIEEMRKSQEIKKLTFKATGTTETISGYKCQKFEVYRDGKLSEEIWTSKDVIPNKELDSEKMARYMKEMRETSKAAFGKESIGSNLDEEANIYNQIYKTGVPMKSVHHSVYGKDYTDEIVKVTQTDIPDKEFQAPAGYKKVTFEEMMMAK
jgi:hypothetical protein